MFKAGLFSGVGAVSLVESYKWLSPDSGDETVDLLAQLVNVTQKIPLTPGNGDPFKRTFDIVMVNVIWFTSMVICIVCAVLATLIQLWSQRYLAFVEKEGGTPDERDRMSNYLYRSFAVFQIPWISLLRMGMHCSIGLYGMGIVLFVFHIDRNLVVFAFAEVSVFGSAYMAMTFLPIFFLNFPYSTPFSAPLWCIWHFSLAVIFSICSGIANLLPGRLVDSESFQDRAENHKNRSVDGLKMAVERYVEKSYGSLKAH